MTWKQAVGAYLPTAVQLVGRSLAGDSREPELALLGTAVRSGDTVVDVGAHRGVYTHALWRAVGRHGHVVAYEPQPELFDYLKRGLRPAIYRNVSLRDVALSDSVGTARLSIPMVDGSPVKGEASLRELASKEAWEVRTRRVDDESFPGRVSFMKIDVEGHEQAVLEGAVDLIDNDRPTLLIEIEARHVSEDAAQTTIEWLRARDYAPLYADERGRLRAVGPGALNRPTCDRYVNNFLFVPTA